MDPQVALNRGYWEYADKVRDQWIASYTQIAKKYRHLKPLADKMIKRINLACQLQTEHAISYDTSRVDECFYAEAVARENEYLEATQAKRDSLDGDFPCGNEEDMRFARRLFSNREMAYLQMGLANEVNPDDLSHVPAPDKPFPDEAFPNVIEPADQPKGRKGFVFECLGQFAEAIACYEAMAEEGRPTDRITCLRRKLPILAPDASAPLIVKHCHNTYWSQNDVEEYHDYSVVGMGTDDMPQGFVWIEWDMRFSGAFEPLSRHFIGLADKELQWNDDLEEKVTVLDCGVRYDLRGSSRAASVRNVGKPTADLRVETDDEGRITFCGMQCDGQRHGLGSEFYYKGKNLLEVQGLWQNGKFTHRCEGDRLVPFVEDVSSLPHDLGL